MKADIVTIFPGFFQGPLDHGITRRACEMGLATIEVHDLRQFTHDRHRTVDDRPFGGGEGMVLKPEPIFECLEPLGLSSREERLTGVAKQSVILLSAQGERSRRKLRRNWRRWIASYCSVAATKVWMSASLNFSPTANFRSATTC